MKSRSHGSRSVWVGWMTLTCAALLAWSPTYAQEEEPPQPIHPLIGAEVVGPGSRSLGFIADIVIDQNSGEIAMYLVKVRGWFGEYGVVPVGNLESQTPQEREGEQAPFLRSDINRATFVNIAKWDGEGSFGRYLDEYQSILSAVYDLDRERLATGSTAYGLLSRAGAGDEMTANSSPQS